MNKDKLYKTIRDNPKNVAFRDLEKLCAYYFGEPRQKGTSHQIYKMPWAGDPRVNIQKSETMSEKQ